MLANVGDTHVYDIANISILLVRVAPDQIKAYYNACLHRGRQLRDRGGRASELRCPFHGYTWHLDGTLKFIPSPWDFPHVTNDNFCLPEVKVGRWGGFVFVNMDKDAEPLEAFLGDLPAQFEPWRFEDRFTEVHVAKVLRCNWKIAQEAFSESLHVPATHPQALPHIGDANTQYDVFGNFSRAISPNGTPSPNLTWVPSEQEILDAMVDRSATEPAVAVLPPGATARTMNAMVARAKLRETIGDRSELLSDAELNDSMYYTVFPNFHPWGTYNRLVYRFRPYRNDPEMCIMDTLFLSPFKGERPPPAPVHWLAPTTAHSTRARWACWRGSSTKTLSIWTGSRLGCTRS